MPGLSLPYSADGGGGAAAPVITENCCVGGNRCVNSAMTERIEVYVFAFVHQMFIRFNIKIKLLYSCLGLGQFEAHTDMPHTHPLPTVWVWLWPGVNCFSTLNIIQCHMLSACPVNVLKLAHGWNINLLRDTACSGEHTQMHNHTHSYACTQGNNDISFKAATFSRIWAGAERERDISKVCAVAWQPWQLNQKTVNLTESVHLSVLHSSSPSKQAQPTGANIIFNLPKKHLFLVGHYRNVCDCVCVEFSHVTLCECVCVCFGLYAVRIYISLLLEA